MTPGFLAQAVEWLVLPFCKKGNPEEVMLGAEAEYSGFDFGKFVFEICYFMQ